MGVVDTIVQKFKLLAGGKTRRLLFKEGIVDENGVPTKIGRTLARRLMGEEYIAEHAEEIAAKLGEYAKLSKAEDEED